MLVKFLARGTGSAQAAADYLLRETDSQGAVREDVAVLRGDPDDVAAVADSLEFDHKYTSGVIAWAPEDQPSDQDIDRVLDEFEQTAWAGLAPDRHAWAAVQHRAANGGVHVHVLAARCDLETGKSLNIAPPGWEQTYGPLVEACNLEHGWSRPDDPARARDQQPGHRAYLEAAARRAGIAQADDPRDQIEAHLLQRVESGTVQDRAGVVAALHELGLDVPREGKHYVTAHDPKSGKRWRLKGALYEHDFDGRPRAPDPATERNRPPDGGRDRRADAADVWRDVARQRERQAAYHRRRYGDAERAEARPAAARLAPAAGDRAESLAQHLQRDLGADAVVVEPRAAPDARDAGDPAARARPDADGQAIAAVGARLKETYDRIRGTLDARVQQAGRAIRDAAVRAGRGLGKAGRGLGRASATVGRSLRTGAESAHRVGEHARETTTANGRTCHDLDRRLRLAFGERQQNDRRLQQCYEGVGRTFSLIHSEAAQKRKDGDRPDRVEGLIESRIQNRIRSHSHDIDL